jgi:D-amino-acid dehydrogenase
MVDRVVVIGAGIVGASVALHLADGGADVVLVDDGRTGRATLAGAGIVARPWRDPGSALFELRSAAVAAYPALAARVGGGLDLIGELYVGHPGPALDETLEALAAALGETARLLSPAEAAAMWPYLAEDLAAVHVPTTARVDGEQIRVGLVDAAVAAGAEVVAGPGVLATSGRRVEGVRVGHRGPDNRADPGSEGGADPMIRATDVVVAAGAWSADVVAAAGVTLAVAPQRGQILHLGVAEDTAAMPVVQPIDADHYLLPFADRRIVVGATRETGSGFDPRVTAAGVAHVLANALGVAPGLATATVGELRVGLRPATPDGEPLLGPVPACPGLWVAGGMGPQGLTLGPYCGQLVAGAVLGRSAEIDLGPWSPGRFG